MAKLVFQQGPKKAGPPNTPPVKGSGTPIKAFTVNKQPIVTNLADADSIISQPKYNSLKSPIDVTDPNKSHPQKDLQGAATYLRSVIDKHSAILDKALVEKKKRDPRATELSHEEASASSGGEDKYKNYLAHVSTYNKYRSKTNLDPRNANGKWGMVDSYGNSNSGGGLTYGEKTPYDSTLQNLVKPYKTTPTIANPRR